MEVSEIEGVISDKSTSVQENKSNNQLQIEMETNLRYAYAG